jgi:hypothetical protein
MKLIKRISNLWKLSSIEITPKNKEEITKLINQETPRMATIVKMHDPVKDFLEE